MFTGIFDSGDLAVDTTASESAGNQNTGHVTQTARLHFLQ